MYSSIYSMLLCLHELFIADQNYCRVPEWEPNAKMSGWSKLLEGGAVPIWQPLWGRRRRQGEEGKVAKWVNCCPVWKIGKPPEELLTVKTWAALTADHCRLQRTNHSHWFLRSTGAQWQRGSDVGLSMHAYYACLSAHFKAADDVALRKATSQFTGS